MKVGRTLTKTIVLTGGGSAGHVMVNLALIPKLMDEGWNISYIGSTEGIEKKLVEDLDQIDYYGISSGKLRRYFDWKNIKDPFKVIKGIFQAYRCIRRIKPDVVFSKGGFVSVPVIVGARLSGVPVVSHESDMTPGLANKISLPFVKKVCMTFPETKQYLSSEKAVHVGPVVRKELKQGNVTRGLSYCDFIRDKPVLLVMGGSLGAQQINQVVRNSLDSLLSTFQIVHICGKGQMDTSIQLRGYKQFEYVNEGLPDLFAITDLVISRAGSNAIFEFLALQKPMLLIPLSDDQSRGDQILNAESFEKSGYANVLFQENLTSRIFIDAVYQLNENRDKYIEHMKKNEGVDAANKILDVIKGISSVAD